MGGYLGSKVDVYILADSTGSMGRQLDAVKKDVSRILEQIRASGADVWFGVGYYRDIDTGGPRETILANQQKMTADLGKITAAISQWEARGGGDDDIPELQLAALDFLATRNRAGWRPEAQRIMVWFGDAPGHDPICKAAHSRLEYDITEESATQKLKDQRIEVVAVSCPGQGLDLDPRENAQGYVSKCGEPGGKPGQATRIAAATGGSHTTDVDPDALATTIIERVRTQIKRNATSKAPVSPAEEVDRAKWDQSGRWDDVFKLKNVAVHTHVLPNGKVLFWGRRDDPVKGTMHERDCTPYVWDPDTGEQIPTPQPRRSDSTLVNLFCSGHAFLPDGRLLVAGGHIADGDGLNQACIYDYSGNTWTPLPVLNSGRWYPTVTTLWDGRMLVTSGCWMKNGEMINNDIPQIWDGLKWKEICHFEITPPLYPHWHVAPDGQVVMVGPNALSYLLNADGEGTWTPTGPEGNREGGIRDYAPSVMYDVGKIIYMGGGNDKLEDEDKTTDTVFPAKSAEVIDLCADEPDWRATDDMHFRRRQHNATVLADGTVLVTGGTQGPGFNSLDDPDNPPVRVAELWDPGTEKWTKLAAEDVDRTYHATAVLLPDATVLSAGGGEFAVKGVTPNPPEHTHCDAQIFHPPYLFRGPRPEITSVPEEIDYGKTFSLKVSGPDIGRVTLIRLSSVTHSVNHNQLCNVLTFSVDDGSVTVTAPERPQICPPGHYMLFVLSKAGVPSRARIVRLGSPVPAVSPETPPGFKVETAHERDKAVKTESTGTRVTVGLTSTCPYGLGACWGGAYEALTVLENVAAVRPIANDEDSTAEVYLNDRGLPNLDVWPQEFANLANASYAFRGVEVTIEGTVRGQDSILQLTGPSFDPVKLTPLEQGVKVQWNRQTGSVTDTTPDERDAYQNLVERYKELRGRAGVTTVTGPLTKTDAGWVLYVRVFEVSAPPVPETSSDVQPALVPVITRPSHSTREVVESLGPLANLIGTWNGTGFNVVTLPVHNAPEGASKFELMLNTTSETLAFSIIGGSAVPNKGSKQPDIGLYGLKYLQEVTNKYSHQELHVEPGFWLNVPSTTVPELPATVVRQGVIPHGNSMLAVGRAFEVPWGPQIDDVDTTPIQKGHRFPSGPRFPSDSPYMKPFENPLLPRDFKSSFVKNPALALREVNEGRNIIRTVVLDISTEASASGPEYLKGGIVDMPFNVENAGATRLDATFWIETVEQEDGSTYEQLQYVQTVILDFIGLDWPHISVATLIKL